MRHLIRSGIANLHSQKGSQLSLACRFQLLGIACLREAMGDTRRRLAIRLGEQDKNLDPARFAFISDRTYTVEEVEQATRTVADTVPEEIRDAPNGKMFLRSFWYRGVAALVMEPEEMHIYTIARYNGHTPRFLLHIP